MCIIIFLLSTRPYVSRPITIYSSRYWSIFLQWHCLAKQQEIWNFSFVVFFLFQNLSISCYYRFIVGKIFSYTGIFTQESIYIIQLWSVLRKYELFDIYTSSFCKTLKNLRGRVLCTTSFGAFSLDMVLSINCEIGSQSIRGSVRGQRLLVKVSCYVIFLMMDPQSNILSNLNKDWSNTQNLHTHL